MTDNLASAKFLFMSPRLTADERREAVIAAAAVEFAAGGFAGTATEAIARQRGLPQPYMSSCFARRRTSSWPPSATAPRRSPGASRRPQTRHGPPSGPRAVLEAMGDAYVTLLKSDRDLLRLQLNAYTACSDPGHPDRGACAVRELWHRVAQVSGVDPKELSPWFASGMLINVIASIDDATTLEGFATYVHGGSGMPSDSAPFLLGLLRVTRSLLASCGRRSS